MPSERVQRQIDRLLDQAEAALADSDWRAALQAAEAALGFDPEDDDATAFVTAARRALDAGAGGGAPAVDNVGVGSGPPSGGSLSARTRSEHSGPSRTPGHGDVPPLPIAGEGRGEGGSAPTSFANGRYEVSKFLGEGGKKRVYLAHDTLLDREVAFALIKTDGLDEVSRSRITREAQAMGRLGTHPNIVTVFDLGVEGDEPYMVTELMGGGDVERLLESRPTSEPPPSQGGGEKEPSPWEGEGVGVGRIGLPLEQTIQIARAVCEGLEFAHSRGIVHRDLKPGNVWLTEDPASGSGQAQTAKIGDFGLAMMTDRSRLTREAMMVGTVSYMPPEQATGGEITPRADLYSLGAMLYEMVTGRPPFLGDDEIAIIGQHINTPPVAPTWHTGACPAPLEALITRLLSKDPSERPESARDVFNALDAIDLTSRGETVERDANSLDSLAGGVFVGRQVEMDQLKAALEDVLGGRGRLVTLVGEPGIGKTRTSEELATYAGLRGAQVLWGRCYEGGGAPPYWPWVQAIRSYVREVDPDELRRQMGSSASVVSEIVTDIKDRLPETQPPAPMDDPESARFRLFDSITSFLKSASQSQPIMIVLDDLHWSDRPTLNFLEFVARELNQSRVLLVCTYRDMELNRRHPLSITLGDLARERLYERVLLRGLTESDIARFVEVTAGFNAPSELSATIHRHTEGNPLFVTEVVRDLVQAGELTEEQLSGRSTWSVRIPEGVREVIGRRLDRLTDRANDIFTTAAVVGREFTLDILRALSEETSEGQMLDVIDEALDAKLIEELPEQVGLYQFTHALVQETLLGELSLTRRVRLHARIAETLEQIYGDEADNHAAELARHFGEAEAVLGADRMVHYLMVAGSELLDVYGHSEATAHYERALSAVDTSVRDQRLGEIYMGLGSARAHALERADLQQAVEALTNSFDIFSDLGDTAGAVAVASTDMPNAHGMVGMSDLVNRALAIAPDGTAVYAYLLSQYVQWISFEEARYARDEFDRAVSIARDLGDEPLELKIRATAVSVHGQQMDWQASQESLTRSFELMETVEDPLSASRIQEGAAMLAYINHDLNASLGHARDTVSVAERSRSRFGTAIALSIFGTTSWSVGHVQSAIEPLDRGLELAPREVRLLNPRGQMAFAVGDYDRGFECIRAHEEAPEIVRSGSSLISLLLVAEKTTGSRVPDREMLDQALQSTLSICTDELVEPMRRGAAIAGVANAISMGYDVADPHSTYSDLMSHEVGVFDHYTPRLLILARLAQHIGDIEAAIGHFEDAVRLARDTRFKPRLAETAEEYAALLLHDGGRDDRSRELASTLEEEALGIAREMGLTPLTERILKRREILKA